MQPSNYTWVGSLVGEILSAPSSQNQRASADMLEEHASKMAQTNCIDIFQPARSVRSPEDFSLGNVLVDVKTRCLDRDFSMPNLISVDRARKILANPEQDIWYWMIDYRIMSDGKIHVVKSELVPIWHLDWNALSIQNLGLGQIQISNWTSIIDPIPNRVTWVKTLVARTRAFYVHQQNQLAKRIKALDLVPC